MRWLAILTLVAAVPLSSLPPGGTFFDDDGNVHEATIEAIADAGITKGCSDAEADRFCPGDTVTRGQMAAFLVRALELPPAHTGPFTDDDTSVFEADIGALAQAGITRGCAPDRFCPEDPVSRGQMAAFLVRALELPPAHTDPFTDDDTSVFEADIAALAQAGVTLGCAPHRFCPDEAVTRDQMASFLARGLALEPLTPPPRPSATIAFTGDTLIHTPVSGAARRGSGYDFRPIFDPVRTIITDADLALCHLEVPLSPTNKGLSGYPSFNGPRELADGLAWAGFDGCSTASNHSFDRGVNGVSNTLDVLDEAGLGHAGTARSPDEADTVTTYQLDDLEVAHISATWWLNGLRLPGDQPWLVEEPIDVERLIGLAETAKADGADFVVVSIHCCVEYQQAPTAYQSDVARTLLASDAIDLVVGHHAHVVQPIEHRNGEYIVYGLGNFLSAQRAIPATTDGVVVVADVALRGERWVTRSITYVPTWVEAGTYRILPAAETVGTGSNTPDAVLAASWRRTRAAIEAYDPPGVAAAERP